ncbi:PQQ-binding-like beta-propeller repeat protein [Humisphaera borealis]|uniref:PQQ-like beta-propeller repeat protein n=1 Tax=Humisphaera borealis TaxID=2807512 RepID=A0A7M2X019_9BACT|nr:PQQ-binding-like beta-propeller repeat protein [Humisphaera borealis]QOV91107.1 PQQ-like beta-propeller repeat protein [Humisphaera borealis]
MTLRFPMMICSVLLLAATTSRGADWPVWRGPSGSGISTEAGWAPWDEKGPRIAWRAQVGVGFSSFVAARGRVYTAGYADDADSIVCLDAETGKVVWKHSYPAELGAKFFEGGTTGTPTVDGDRVYFLSRAGDVWCLDAAAGKPIWSANIQKQLGVNVPGWGFGGAPVVHQDLLLLNAGEAGVALDKASGKVVWQSGKKDAGYSTPYLTRVGTDTLAIFGSAQSYIAVNPQTGKEAWRVRWVTQFGVNAADPIVDGGRMFISSGYGKGCTLVQLTADQPPKEVWKSRVLRTQMNAAVLFDGHLFGVDGDTTEKASLKCVELSTGTEKWVHPGFGSGTVILADGKLIALAADGELSVAPASPQGFKQVASARVLTGKCWTVPVLSDGRIYCRNWKGQIVCVDVRK